MFFKKKESKEIRVRVAPSPTGALHIGTARCALLNYLFAKKVGGKFILRIEDTDLQRSDQKWTEDIISGLKWLGMSWDEGPDIGGEFGPYKDTQRLGTYGKYLQQLLDQGKAYYCFCSEEELEDKRQQQMASGMAPKYDGKCSHLSKEEVEKNISAGRSCVIRFRVASKKVKFSDLIRKEVEFDTSLLGDIIVAKNLETPLYHFSVVVDDYLMKISHIIRGEDHLANTPKHILLQEALGFPTPQYGHLPLILAPDRSKMSKRYGSVSISEYKSQGYLPEAIINFMVLLGWNPGTDREIFSLAQLEKEFSIEKVQKSGAIFNIDRFDFINGLYIREKSIEKLTEFCIPYLLESKLISEKDGEYVNEVGESVSTLKLQKIIDISRSRMKKLSEISEFADFFFKNNLSYEKNLLQWQKMTDGELIYSLEKSEKVLSEISNWDIEKIEEELLKASLELNKEKNYPEKNKGYLLWPLRVALSGKKFSPSPFEIAEIIGKEKVISRIQFAKRMLA